MSLTSERTGSGLSEARSRGLVLVAAAACVGLIVVLGGLQWRQQRYEATLSHEIAQSHERQRLVSDYLQRLQDIETGQRGYLVTGSPAFLEPFNRARRTIGRTSAEMRQRFVGRAEEPRVSALADVGQRRLSHAQSAVDLLRSGRRNEAFSLIRAGTGKRLMDDAREHAAVLVDREETLSRRLLLEANSVRVDRQRSILLAEFALLAALLVMIVGLIRMVRRLERSSGLLRDSATRQAAIFENATDAMMMLDQRGHIEATNAAAERLFGRERKSLVGQSNLVLFKDPPPIEASQAYLRRLAAEPEAGGNKQDFVGLRDDGSEVETEVVTTPIRLEDGLHFLAVARDATERRRVERLKTEFVATVSHELRTPLTSIAGALGLLANGAAGELQAKALRLITIAHNNSERLVRLINDILDIEKIESGKITLDLDVVDLNDLITQVVQANDAFAQQHGVSIEQVPGPDAAFIIADRDRLVQVLTNLLSNAIKFSPERGTVSILVQASGSVTRLSVRDRGMGIPEDFQARIFTKFAQADSTDARQKGGTGLGLSIVRELVARMDGRVWFDTVPGEGTTFHVELPTASALPPGDETAEVMGRIAEHALPHVLHVDDDVDMLRIVADSLEHRFEVHSTPSVAEADASLRRFRFDAVILDIGMADGDGLDLVPVARAMKEDIPIVLFTAQDVGDLRSAGVDAWLTKSKADLEILSRSVATLIEGRDVE